MEPQVKLCIETSGLCFGLGLGERSCLGYITVANFGDLGEILQLENFQCGDLELEL